MRWILAILAIGCSTMLGCSSPRTHVNEQTSVDQDASAKASVFLDTMVGDHVLLVEIEDRLKGIPLGVDKVDLLLLLGKPTYIDSSSWKYAEKGIHQGRRFQNALSIRFVDDRYMGYTALYGLLIAE